MSTKQVDLITNDAELSRAIEEFYILAAPLEGTAAEPDAYTLALRDEIAAYQFRAGHTPAPPKTVVGLLEVEMFKRKLRQRGLADLLGVPETRLSEILRGKRGMNLDFARRLYTRLGVPAEVVLLLDGGADAEPLEMLGEAARLLKSVARAEAANPTPLQQL